MQDDTTTHFKIQPIGTGQLTYSVEYDPDGNILSILANWSGGAETVISKELVDNADPGLLVHEGDYITILDHYRFFIKRYLEDEKVYHVKRVDKNADTHVWTRKAVSND